MVSVPGPSSEPGTQHSSAVTFDRRESSLFPASRQEEPCLLTAFPTSSESAPLSWAYVDISPLAHEGMAYSFCRRLPVTHTWRGWAWLRGSSLETGRCSGNVCRVECQPSLEAEGGTGWPGWRSVGPQRIGQTGQLPEVRVQFRVRWRGPGSGPGESGELHPP